MTYLDSWSLDQEEIDILTDLTFSKVKYTDNSLVFYIKDIPTYVMGHIQDCCESIDLIDFDENDLEKLVDTPILTAYKSSNSTDPPLWEKEESYTWTFYNISTVKGSVNLRWYGASNGYYSEDVNIYKVPVDRDK